MELVEYISFYLLLLLCDICSMKKRVEWTSVIFLLPSIQTDSDLNKFTVKFLFWRKITKNGFKQWFMNMKIFWGFLLPSIDSLISFNLFGCGKNIRCTRFIRYSGYLGVGIEYLHFLWASASWCFDTLMDLQQ